MKMNKLSVIVISLASVALVVSGCLKKPVASPANQNQNTSAGTTTAEIDISGWKTYRNEAYGFEFRYPVDWILNNLKDGVSIKYSKKWEFGMKEGFSPFSVVIIKESLQGFIKSYEDDFLNGAPLTRIISQEGYTLDTESGAKLIGNNAEGINSYYIFVVYNHQKYLISFNENEEVQRTILSTFHFLK